jgi:hypothetical protein
MKQKPDLCAAEMPQGQASTLLLDRVPAIRLTGSQGEPAHFASAELGRYLGMILENGDGADGGKERPSPGHPLESDPVKWMTLTVNAPAFESDEGYAWRAAADGVEIEAGGDLGLVFGVYAFLRDVCGCVFAAPGPDGEFVPCAKPLAMSVSPVRREPVLWYRGIQCYFFESPEHYRQQIDWLTKNGYNYVEYHLGDPADGKVLHEQVDPKTGQPLFPVATGPSAFDEAYFEKHLLPEVKKRGLKLDFNHHNLWYWIPPHQHKATHPQWFSQVNGKRGDNLNQLCICTSNAQVMDELVARVKGFLRRMPQVRVVGVVPEDGFGMCQCAACIAGDVNPQDAFTPPRDHRNAAGANWSLINRYARLLNTVARAIRDEFPGVLVGGSAYVDFTFAPRDIPLEPNLVMQVAVYWRDGARPLAGSDTSQLNTFFYDVLKGWRQALSGRLLLYEYYMGMMAQKCLPYPMAEVIREDWKALREIGVEGASVQCCAGATRSYVMNLTAFGLAAWGEDFDAARIAADYARALYGKAGLALGWVFERWHQAMAALKPLDPSLHAHVGVDLSWQHEAVLKPDGFSIAYFWRSLGGDAPVDDAIAAARALADTDKARRNVEELARYLGYCRLAAAAMEATLRAHEARSANPSHARVLLQAAAHNHVPAVIEYIQSNPMPGWVLPRMLRYWEYERKTRITELNALAPDA